MKVRIFRNVLVENSTVAKIATMAKNGQTYKVKYYNLDMIISISKAIQLLKYQKLYGLFCSLVI